MAIAAIYADLIRQKRKSLEDVPAKIRDEVEKLLEGK